MWVNRNFVKCYTNKKLIKALELPLQAQHNDVSSVFIAFTERKLWLFYGKGHKKVPVFVRQRPCNGNFAFRFRARSILHISVCFFAVGAKLFYARGTVKKH